MNNHSPEIDENMLSDRDKAMCDIGSTEEDVSHVSSVDLRAHHLFNLSQLHYLQVHKSSFAENLYRKLKSAQFKMMGRGEGKEFADHLIDSILAISQDQVGEIKITNSHDIICEKCPQRNGDHCKVFGKEFSVDFLAMVDEAIVRNTNGVLELGQSYPPDYLKAHLGEIRRAVRKTLLEIPELKRQSNLE